MSTTPTPLVGQPNETRNYPPFPPRFGPKVPYFPAGPITTSPAGAHSHSVSVNSTSSAHTHPASVNSTSSTHNHPVTVGTANAPHSHPISGNSGGANAPHNHPLGNTGGNGAHENRPPYYALCYIIQVG